MGKAPSGFNESLSGLVEGVVGLALTREAAPCTLCQPTEGWE